MKTQLRKDITRIIREDKQAVDDALAKGVRDAMLRHKKDGNRVVVERNGKIEKVKPEDLGY
jgi:hypothetical protein